MKTPDYSTAFRKDVKRLKKQQKNITDLQTVMNWLINETPIPSDYEDHKLAGNYEGARELHILPDWLLIYRILDNKTRVLFERTGSHSDLFKK